MLMAIGSAFLIAEINPDFAVRRYIWPTVMIIVGIFFIFRPRRRHRHGEWFEKKNAGTQTASSTLNEQNYSQEDIEDTTSIFGHPTKNNLSTDFNTRDMLS